MRTSVKTAAAAAVSLAVAGLLAGSAPALASDDGNGVLSGNTVSVPVNVPVLDGTYAPTSPVDPIVVLNQ